MTTTEVKTLAQKFLEDQAAIIKKHGHAPKLSGPKFQRAMRDTRKTFETLHTASRRITS
jgi:hypothetical protein